MTNKLIIVGLLPFENWFMSNRYIYGVDGIAPCQLARPGGGGTNALTKIIEIVYDNESECTPEW